MRAPRCFVDPPWVRSDDGGSRPVLKEITPAGDACRSWARHHDRCPTCGRHDWYRPAWLRPVAPSSGGSVRVQVGDQVVRYVADPEGLLCDIGLQLYARWVATAALWRRENPGVVASRG